MKNETDLASEWLIEHYQGLFGPREQWDETRWEKFYRDFGLISIFIVWKEQQKGL